MNFKVISIGYNWINTCMVGHHRGKHPFPYFLFVAVQLVQFITVLACQHLVLVKFDIWLVQFCCSLSQGLPVYPILQIIVLQMTVLQIALMQVQFLYREQFLLDESQFCRLVHVQETVLFTSLCGSSACVLSMQHVNIPFYYMTMV